ncbi:uncharacterized protein LOC114325418 [Diabrotica virgifera virgifera]|uniref:Uncharacterized protein LOC114325418 n=1 Tax=Diabrotica virgifera virgifera TaxID=50390 RepID=A0A6P7F699_DIAVI|nr:uncharacterized protein LOC114325418 [Diabrotica virgifera virgifera]
MKYLVFFVCIVAYASATAVNLASFLEATNTTTTCACKQSLDNILAKIKEQNTNLNNANVTLNSIEVTIVKNVSVEVANQTQTLCKLEERLSVLIKKEVNIGVILDVQTTNLTNIVNLLIDICGNTECIENELEDQNCILENIENVSLAAVEDCNGDTCRPTIGFKG